MRFFQASDGLWASTDGPPDIGAEITYDQYLATAAIIGGEGAAADLKAQADSVMAVTSVYDSAVAKFVQLGFTVEEIALFVSSPIIPSMTKYAP